MINKNIHKNTTEVIAEIAQSYEGSFDNLISIIDALCRTKVDMIMFQVIFANEIATKDNDNYGFFKQLELDKKEINTAIARIKENGKRAIAEVFGTRSANALFNAGVDGFKIHPADVSNIPFIENISKLGLPLFIGVGGCTEEEVRQAVSICNGVLKNKFTLMHGYQVGPTPLEEANFGKISELGNRFDCMIGYSDHCPGSIDGKIESVNPLAIYSPALAVAYGATVIEKHVIIDRSKLWEDYESAITPEELDLFIDYLRIIEESCGDFSLDFKESEKKYRVSSKKYIVASQDLPIGTVLAMEDINFKRIKNPSIGIINFTEIEGRVVKRNISAENPITLEDVN